MEYFNDVVVEKFENFLAVDDWGKYIPDHDEALKEMVSLVRKGASSWMLLQNIFHLDIPDLISC